MKLWDKVKSGIARKASSTWGALLTLVTPGQPVWRTNKDFESIAREGYAQNPYVYACVRYIATAVAGVPWKLTRQGAADQESQAIDQHPLLELLRRPNPEQGRTRFVEQVITQLLLGGDGYIERVGPNNLRLPPLELYALRPDRMKIKPGTAVQRVAGYTYEAGGSKREFLPEEILHLCLLDPLNDWYGLSPARPSARSIDQNNDGRAWNVSMLQNGARLSGAFVTSDQLNDEQYKRLKTQTEEDHSGSKKVGKFMLLEGGLEWKEMSLSPKDMDWLEGMKLSARETAICFLVPPELLGDSSNKTYSNYQEARKAFYQETVLPMLDYLRDELNNWLVPLYGGGIYLDYNSDEIEALQEDRDKLYTRMGLVYDKGIVTRNEARTALGFPPDTTDESSDQFKQPAANPFEGFGSSASANATGDGKSIKGHLPGCTCGCETKAIRPLTMREISMKQAMMGYFSRQREAAIDAIDRAYGRS